MTDGTIYRSREGERRIKALYDALVEDLPASFDREYVETAYGDTHVLLAGDEADPPLFVFHGGNMPNPVSLEWFLPLAASHRIHAPDTVGHPGHSAEQRLSTRDGSYGRWAIDVVNAFGYDRVPMVGASYGGGIVLHAAAEAPGRIERAGLVVPSGLGTGSIVRMAVSVIVPMVIYRLTSSEYWLRRSIEPIFTESIDEIDPRIVELVALSYDEVRLETEFPRTMSEADLAGFDAPTLLAVAEEDVFFPPGVVIPNAEEAIPDLASVVRLADQSHFPGRRGREYLIERLRAFLAG